MKRFIKRILFIILTLNLLSINCLETNHNPNNQQLIMEIADISIERESSSIPELCNIPNNSNKMILELARKNKLGLELLEAIHNNDNKHAIELIEQGANLNIKNGYGFTALMLAVITNKKEIAELLINKGADLNTKDNVDYTLLLTALNNSTKEMAELLIDKGADIGLKDKNYALSILFSAVKAGYKEIVELLINKGVNLDMHQPKGLRTALMAAAYCKHNDTVELLIEHDANTEIINIADKTFWDYVDDKDKEKFKKLIQERRKALRNILADHISINALNAIILDYLSKN